MGERLDEKTDQYSFCVALFKGLCGRRTAFFRWTCFLTYSSGSARYRDDVRSSSQVSSCQCQGLPLSFYTRPSVYSTSRAITPSSFADSAHCIEQTQPMV
jgi:hypothetical protein